MGIRTWGASVLLAVAATATWIPPAHPEDSPEATPVEVLTKALEAARAAEQGDKDASGALEDAMEDLKDRAEKAREECSKGPASAAAERRFAKLWNSAMTTLHYHGEKSSLDYVLSPVPTYSDGGISLGLPVGSRWTFKYTGESQHILSIFEGDAAGERLCHVKVWTYSWNTVYSGVGGENYKKLAKVMHELDRDSMAKKGRKASPRVTAKRLNSEFTRAQFYFVEGFDVDEEKTLRRRNYYIKDKSRTYNIELIEYIDAVEGEDAVTTWQRTDEDPERAAMLASIAPVESD